MTNKKADIDWKFFLAIVVIAVSIIVLLWFYYQYQWKGEIDKQTCHESAILKASMPRVMERAVVDLPLKCKTKKICITDNFMGGECEEFQGEKFEVERVSKDEEKQLAEIKDIIANSLYDCWSMMGEGKLNIFSREFELKRYSSKCVVCSRIAFDKELKEKLAEEFPEGIPGISNYLDTKKIPNKNMNYSEFLTGFKGERPYGQLLEGKDYLGFEQQAIVFQEFDRTTAPEDATGTISGLAAAAGVAYVTKSIKLSAISFFGGGYAGRKGGALLGGLIGEDYIASWAFSPYRADPGKIETLLVKTVEKEKKEINGQEQEVCYSRIPADSIPLEADKTKTVYGFASDGKFIRSQVIEGWFSDSFNFEEINFPEKADLSETAEKQREFFNQVLEELTIKCYNLESFQCDDFESYV